MTIEEKLDELREDFDIFDDPRDKFSQLMDIGKQAPTFDPINRTEDNRIRGCTSQAWLMWEKKEDESYTFQADSDAFIVKGLLTILTTIFENQQLADIIHYNGETILSALGLDGAISSQRTNGFVSALEKIKRELQ